MQNVRHEGMQFNLLETGWHNRYILLLLCWFKLKIGHLQTSTNDVQILLWLGYKRVLSVSPYPQRLFDPFTLLPSSEKWL